MKKLLKFFISALLTLPLIGCPNEPDAASLTINNQSFSDLLDVQWQGVIFRANSVENSILAGHSITKDVDAGSGYIFFKRKSNPTFARTREVLTLEKNESREFFFTDNILIVEANNPDNTGTLKDMITTVVFYDDAEGAIQPYAERRNATYSGRSSYKGNNSIAISDGSLKLILDLNRKAELTFWFENSSSATSAFSIDGTKKTEWQGRYNWSYQKYPLETGTREIVWTSSYSYLYLDNILVFYTE
jgi:hypothetical protein